MDKKSPNRKHSAKRIKRIATAMREFAKVYNDYKSCTLKHDLLRMLYPNSAIKDTARKLERDIKRYRLFQQSHPEANLPELILRKGKDGTMIGLPEGVLKQLAEFRIDPEKLNRAKGVIVTAAQFGALLNVPFWNALKRYAEHLGYVLVVLPIKYGPIKTVYQKELDERVLTSTFAEELKKHMLFEGMLLANGMLNLNVMRMRPTLMKFLSARVAQRGYNVSQIFASPKLELRHLPRLMHDYPKAAMTTGAVTHPSYNVDNLGQQDLTGEIAAAEHTYAALIVEFSSKKTFHYRQLLADSTGVFYDIEPVNGGAVRVSPDSIEHRPDAVDSAVLGDWHVGKTHQDVREITFGDGGMLQTIKPKKVFLHDLFDGYSISHWDDQSATRRAFKALTGLGSVENELNKCVEELKWMHQQLPGATLNSVASNHNEFLWRYLEAMGWGRDPRNMVFCARLFADLVEELITRAPAPHDVMIKDPVNEWIRRHAPFATALERQDVKLVPEGPDSKKICVSFHGDIGPNGPRGTSMEAMREWNQWVIIGHSHSAAILGPIWRVGTSGHLREHYVSGPRTTWTHTHAIIYENGQRQLINIVNGAWHGQCKKRPRSAGIGTGNGSHSVPPPAPRAKKRVTRTPPARKADRRAKRSARRL